MDQDAAKRRAAWKACEFVESGMVVGLGTGSTAAHAVKRLGERAKNDGLRITGVPTSLATERLAREVGLPLATLDDVDRVDLTIDGADEVDPKLDLIKGLGGALLREKIVASVTARQIIIVDATKIVPKLGTKAPLPVEVLPFGQAAVKRALEARGWKVELRRRDGKPFVTDNGNLVFDVRFAEGIEDAAALEREVNTIPGVVDNGLFVGRTWKVVVAEADGSTRILSRP
ncbi:MAG TPA: ribose-5-phosphate isomerase RpiA [Candidatus Thermoplasmatota archaeon]|nr:ribose-5-phosphate isomerase RpiA [Candidatus Thermoplasmatota archaeon]